MNKVLYIHRKPDGEVFYVGIGTPTRAYSIHSRSKHWKNVVCKYGHTVEILADGLALEDALEFEILLIKHYGRLDLKTGTLVNKTIGGEGRVGCIETEESKRKKSETWKKKYADGYISHNKGKYRPPYTSERKDKIRASKIGKKRKPFTNECRDNMSKAKRMFTEPQDILLVALSLKIFGLTKTCKKFNCSSSAVYMIKKSVIR